jgi:soluble lytic murein transglycosylase
MKKRLITTFLLLVILLVSCNLPLIQNSDGIDLNPFDENTPKPSPTPTITPTPQPEARITLGEKDILSGDYDAALNEFWQARSQSTDPEIIAAAQLGVGRILLLQKDYRGAVDQLTWLLTNFSDGKTRNEAYFFIAKAYEGLGEYRLAADAYQNYLNALPGSLDSEILEMQGDALMQAGDYPAAKISYLQAVEKALPEAVEPLSIKVAQAASAAGDDADAISRYLALYESSTTDYIKAQVNLLLGQIYLKLEMPEQAYARFQDSVIQYPIYYDTFSG